MSLIPSGVAQLAEQRTVNPFVVGSTPTPGAKFITMNSLVSVRDVDMKNSLSVDLVGTWALLSRVDHTLGGERRIDPSLGSDPIALLFYDHRGHFAAQFMKRERNPGSEMGVTSAAPNNSRALGGYDAYFGTYTVDDTQSSVTQRLDGALSPENVGQVLTRVMTVVGDELRIRLETGTTAGEPIIRTLRWQRVA